MTSMKRFAIALLLGANVCGAHRIRLRPDAGAEPYSPFCWDAYCSGEALKVWSCDSSLPERQTGWFAPATGSTGPIKFYFPNQEPLCAATNGLGFALVLAACDGSNAQQFTNISGGTTSSHHYLQQWVGSTRGCVQVNSTPNNATRNNDPIILGKCSTTAGQPIEQSQRWENIFGVQPDVRVSKGVGSKGELAVRLSVIEDFYSPVDLSADFDYSAGFQKAWRGLWLYSRLKMLSAPGVNTWNVGGSRLNVKVPVAGQGVRGVIFGDPCMGPVPAWNGGNGGCNAWQNGNGPGDYGKGIWNVEKKFPAVLNLMQSNPSEAVDFFAMLGDNWYDQCGDNAQKFYSRLETPVKTTLLITMPGNHDYWIAGKPEWSPPGYTCAAGTPGAGDGDQLGNGFMQYYGQDTLGASDSTPYDFTTPDPDHGSRFPALATSSNFFSYYMIGNVGVISYSNAASWATMEPSFEEACGYFEKLAPASVLIMSHWSYANQDGSLDDAPTITQRLRQTFAGCANAMTMFGHSHCNDENSSPCTNIGEGDCYMIGATGMSDSACDAHYGFVYLDSTGGSVKLWEFRMGDASSDLSDPLIDCLGSSGIAGCTQHAYMQWTVSTGRSVREA